MNDLNGAWNTRGNHHQHHRLVIIVPGFSPPRDPRFLPANAYYKLARHTLRGRVKREGEIHYPIEDLQQVKLRQSTLG